MKKKNNNPSTQQQPKKVELTKKDELTEAELEQASGGLLTTTLSNLANMRHEMLKNVANNLR